jgi:hypothetical protein
MKKSQLIAVERIFTEWFFKIMELLCGELMIFFTKIVQKNSCSIFDVRKDLRDFFKEYVTYAQCIFGPFLSGCFFPPNDRAQNHTQENPLLVLFLLAQKCLWTRIMRNKTENPFSH